MGLLAVCAVTFPARANATPSSFRLIGVKVEQKKLKIDLAVEQKGQKTQIDFYLHPVVPKHRDHAYAGPPLTSGLLAGSFSPAPGTNQLKLEVNLDELTPLGIVPGKEVWVGAHWPIVKHEWGVCTGNSSHANIYANTHRTIPTAQKNSHLRLKRRIPPALKGCWLRSRSIRTAPRVHVFRRPSGRAPRLRRGL